MAGKETATPSRSSLSTGALGTQKTGGVGRIIGWTLVLLILLGGLGTGAYFMYIKARNPTMHFVNGLDVPFNIVIGGQTIPLAPQSRVARVLEPGSYTIEVRNDAGDEVITEQVEVPGFTDVVVYNVGGVALLRSSSVTFRERNTGLERERIEYPLFQTYVTDDEVDYVFETPPEEIRVRGTPPQEVREFFGEPEQMEFDIPFTWEGTISYLMYYANQLHEAIKMLNVINQLDPLSPQVRHVSLTALRTCLTPVIFPAPYVEVCGPVADVYTLGLTVTNPLPGTPAVNYLQGEPGHGLGLFVLYHLDQVALELVRMHEAASAQAPVPDAPETQE